MTCIKQFSTIFIDENFAREIMQLFTMGTLKLKMDGSPKLDVNGSTILAYTNDDIESLSRAWTGFDRQDIRGNIEITSSGNEVDPMSIITEWRDRFPKTDTTGGYIGDNYPLCNDFPSKPFLKKGATYRLLGSSGFPELMEDSKKFKRKPVVRAVLNETSALRALLRNENQAGNCNFRNIVTLQTNLDCSGIECDVDTVRVVEVEPNLFYEFVHPPCVTFPFYNDAVEISPESSNDPVMCADPKLAVASEACCNNDDNIGERNSMYSGERMKLAMAEDRCADISRVLCDVIDDIDGPNYLNKQLYFWTTNFCVLQVKVKRNGSLTIVHKPNIFLEQVEHVNQQNENFFKVYWEQDGGYPTVDNGCDGACEVLSEGLCLCDTAVVENIVFNSMPSSKAEIVDKLNVGALDPTIFEGVIYTSTVSNNGDFIAHLKDNQFSAETIFEYDDYKGRTFFVKNINSSVFIYLILLVTSLVNLFVMHRSS